MISSQYGKILLILTSLIITLASCRLTDRTRVDIASSGLQTDLNRQIQHLVHTDSIRIFEEITAKKSGEQLGNILYIQLYGAKKIPADNNIAEQLAKKICLLIVPQIPKSENSNLWKIQFVDRYASGRTSIHKIFNFIPAEIQKKY